MKAKQQIESLLATYLDGLTVEDERFKLLTNRHIEIMMMISIELSGFIHKLIGVGPDVNELSRYISYWTKECLPKNEDHCKKIMLIAAIVQQSMSEITSTHQSTHQERTSLLNSSICAAILAYENGSVSLKDLGLTNPGTTSS